MRDEPRELSRGIIDTGSSRSRPTVCRLNVDARRGNLVEAWNLHDIPF